jgi:aspartyl-tRNA(Asn)/glutamyl-tRNA(Gln) amidotransferase subunit B
MPELPEARRRRFLEEYGLSFDDASGLADSRAMADYYEEVARAAGNGKAAANWILNELVRELKNSNTAISDSPVSAERLAELIKMIEAGTISGKMAKDALIEMYRSGRTADAVVAEMGGAQVSDESELLAIVQQVVADNPKQVENYRAGKTSLMGFFVGQVMKASGGRANPQIVNKLLKNALDQVN